MERPDEHSPSQHAVGSPVVRNLTTLLKNDTLSVLEKSERVRTAIANRMREIIGFLHYVLSAEQDITVHNMARLLALPTDDSEFRRIVCADAAEHDVSLMLARMIEEECADAGRNVRPRLATLESSQKPAALSALIRYVQYLLSTAHNGENVRSMLSHIASVYDSEHVMKTALTISDDPDVIELFLRLERACAAIGINVSAQLPAMREMLEYCERTLHAQ